MRSKKNRMADIEKRRNGFFLFGLTVSMSFTLAAFEWSSFEKQLSIDDYFHEEVAVLEQPIDEIEIEKPQPKKQPQAQSSEEVELVEEIVKEIKTTDEDKEEDKDKKSVDKIFEIIKGFDDGEGKGPVIDKEVQTVNVAEHMPHFKSCKDAGAEDAKRACTDKELLVHLQSNIVYPQESITIGEHGTVYVSFVVTERGNVEDVSVAKSVSSRLDKEAVRVIESLPKFIPGKQGGKVVRVRYTVPIKFRLH